jgi:hypothetical protein
LLFPEKQSGKICVVRDREEWENPTALLSNALVPRETEANRKAA